MPGLGSPRKPLLFILLVTTMTLMIGCGEKEAPPVETPTESSAEPAAEHSSEQDDYEPTVTETLTVKMEDWDAIERRGLLRVLVTPSRTNFFVAADKGRGFEFEMFRLFEKEMNDERKDRRQAPFRVVFVPVPHDQLLPFLIKGYGDVAAAMLTVTPERQQEVDFSSPYLTDVSEVLVRHRDAPGINSLDDLAGSTIAVAAGTSYWRSLESRNLELKAKGLQPMNILGLRHLNSEDVLDLIDTGLCSYTFVDRPFAELWSSVLGNIVIQNDIKIAEGRQIAWAVRKGNRDLAERLSAFARKYKKGSMVGNMLFKRYYRQTKWLKAPLATTTGKLEKYRNSFEVAGEKYGFDWLLLAMQGYQESQFDPNTVSSAGAIGIMQLLPATAADMGSTNLRDPHENIMTGAKYMDWIRNRYFSDDAITPENKICFTLAAYNAGFGRVRKWRSEAAAAGVDPNQWFGQVEQIALKKTGHEPVRYVGNIIKFHSAMTQFLSFGQERERLLGK